MKRYTVHFTDEAWGVIQAQIHYIAIENRAPVNAERWLACLLDAVDTLEAMPGRHGLDVQQTQLHGVDVHRMVFNWTYLVFNTVDQKRSRVSIVSFHHGARENI